MTSYVLDASVAAKWFIPDSEDLTAEASHLLANYADDRLGFSVPDLFWPEVGNVVLKAARQRRISVQDAQDAIATLKLQEFRTHASDLLIEPAMAIALSTNCTAYDGIYVALAVMLDHTLITADKRLVNALQGRFNAKWLGAL